MIEEAAYSMENLCRACMTNVTYMRRDTRTTNHKQCISEKPSGSEDGPTIMELLEIVQPLIKVDINDHLPKSICLGCIQQLQLTHEFLTLYSGSDKKFRKLLKEVYLQEDVNVSSELHDSFEEFIPDQALMANNEGLNASGTEIQFDIEMENLGETMSVQRDTLAIDEYADSPADSCEIDDEHEVDKTEVFDSPYNDASDKKLTPAEDTISNTQSTKPTTSKRRKGLIQSCAKRKNPSTVKQKSLKEKNKNNKSLPPLNDDGSITCQECEIVLENVKLWRKHMRDGHRLENSTNSKEESKVVRPIKSHKCEYCGKVFQKTSAYNIHLRVHTGEEPYLCIECGKSFKCASSIYIHMLRHKGQKTFQCPHCPKKFVCSSGLYGHMMIHNNDKPYVCDICGRGFKMACMLKNHNLYHKDIRNFPCEYCDLRFVTAEKQRRHTRTHTGEKPYSCKYCERAFAQSNDCNKHMKQHLGENIFQCELCPLRFPLVRELRVHFATHKDDDEETRTRNLAAREAAEKSLKIKLGIKVD